MAFILFIILFVWIISLSKRVSSLEKNKVASPQAVASPVQPIHAAVSGMSAPVVMPQASTVASVPSVAPAIEHEKEDSEFVWAKYLARAGVGAILLGVAFFLKLAIDYNWIGVMGRIAVGVIIGLAGLIIGQILRAKYKSYSDVLIGGGLAVLYVTVFCAHYFYDLIGSPVALGLMVGITALAVIMSVIDKAEGLARIGIIGGFLAPLLISIEHTGLFDLLTYALILDIGVLITAFSQRWHRLNFIAFVGTFILYAVALTQSFTPDLRIPVLLFTTIFFFVFLAVSVMHHFMRKEKSNSLDVVFITLNAIWYGVAVYGLMAPVAADYLGFYMLGIALIYAVVAFVSFVTDRSDRMLNQYLTGLCVVFLTAAIPMQFDGSWITVMWFLEAVILFGIDLSLKGKNLYSLGSVVFGLGLFRYFVFDTFERIDIATWNTVFNSRFCMLLVIVIIALTLGYIVKKGSSGLAVSVEEGVTDMDLKSLRSVGTFFFVVANILSIYLITSEVSYHYRKEMHIVNRENSAKIIANEQYLGLENAAPENKVLWSELSEKNASLQNQRNVAISIAWAIYATVLLVFGFMRKSRGFRIAGLVFIFITLLKVFIDIWNFGGIYRVIGSVAVGFIALLGSFLYAKYKHRIKDVLVASLIVGAMVLGAGSASAAETSSKYVAPINTNNVTGSVMLDIPPSALSKTNIDDIRIYDQGPSPVPYVVLDGNVSTGQNSISTAITNSTVRGGESTAILDIGQTGIIHNAVSLDLSGSDSFTRTVSVYGSDSAVPVDSASWRLITSSGYVYSYSDSRAGLSAKNTMVSYPKNSSRYLKIVISSTSGTPLNIFGARISTVPPVYGIRDIRTVTLTPQHVSVIENPNEKSTEITIDLGDIGIYSHQVTLALVGDQQFIRRAVVQHMNSVDGTLTGQNWAMLGEGNIFNIQKPLFNGSNLIISYPEVKSRFIRVVIFNKDDQPVSFSQNASDIKIESKVRSILFDAQAGKSYAMYFGNPAAVRPQYDFASIKAYEDISPAIATLGAVSENKDYIPPAEVQKPWSERNRVVLNSVLVLLVLVVGGIVYMYVRKVRNPVVPAEPTPSV
jgi:hypothetical protein